MLPQVTKIKLLIFVQSRSPDKRRPRPYRTVRSGGEDKENAKEKDKRDLPLRHEGEEKKQKTFRHACLPVGRDLHVSTQIEKQKKDNLTQRHRGHRGKQYYREKTEGRNKKRNLNAEKAEKR